MAVYAVMLQSRADDRYTIRSLYNSIQRTIGRRVYNIHMDSLHYITAIFQQHSFLEFMSEFELEYCQKFNKLSCLSYRQKKVEFTYRIDLRFLLCVVVVSRGNSPGRHGSSTILYLCSGNQRSSCRIKAEGSPRHRSQSSKWD